MFQKDKVGRKIRDRVKSGGPPSEYLQVHTKTKEETQGKT